MKLSSSISVLFCTILFNIWLEASSTDIYVTPFKSCLGDCVGSISQPYDNLLVALSKSTDKPSPVIILLASDTADHYGMTSEQGSSGSYSLTLPLTLSFATLEIKPLFCEEASGLSLPSGTKCINKDQTLTVLLKTMKLDISVTTQLIVQNIVFNAIEAVLEYQPDTWTPGSSECANNRERCCPPPGTSSSTSFGGLCNYVTTATRVCDYGLCYDDLPTTPFFRMMNTFQEAKFLNMHLVNFWGNLTEAFLKIESNSNSGDSTIVFENCVIDDIHLQRGLIYIEEFQGDITVSNMTFSNYNKWPRYSTRYISFHQYGDSIPSNYFYEGYLLLVNKTIQGNINIVDSTFQKMNSTSRRGCDEDDTFYQDTSYVVNDDVLKPSNLNILCNDHRDDSFVSSLIYIREINGAFSVQNSTFSTILGVAGSVVRIQNITGDDTSFSFTDSLFDNNFAISRFANIFITTEYFDYYSASCPSLAIKNSTFSNTRGCAGSYGNVGYFCADAYYDHDCVNSTSPNVAVTDSIFKNNLLSLSNSLATNGSCYVLLERNTFQDNGGVSTGELFDYSISRSELPLINLTDAIYSGSGFIGQTSAVYIARFTKLYSQDNIYKGNWSPYQGLQALGTSLTLLNWTHNAWVPNSITFKNDQFIDHTGVPPIVNPDQLRELNCYSSPLITLGRVLNYENQPNLIGITLVNATFANNTAIYDTTLSKCTSSESQNLQYYVDFKDLINDNVRYKSGFLKFLTYSEMEETYLSDENTIGFGYDSRSASINSRVSDITGLSFIGGRITNNTVSSEGCLFPALWIRSYMLEDIYIEGNIINNSSEPFIEENGSKIKAQAETAPILNIRSGIFCGFQKDVMSVTHSQNIIANKLIVKNNVGPIFSLFPDEENHLFLMNSIFINNTCEYTASIIALDASNITSFNNLFVANTNKFGTAFITSSSSYHSSISTLYLQNTGRHAALTYSNDRAIVAEISSVINGNTANPISYFFSDRNQPQGGLYYISQATLTVQISQFSQNNGIGGIVVSSVGTILFDKTLITSHRINGSGLLGHFLDGTTLELTETNFTDNAIINNPVSDIQPSMIKIASSNFELSNLTISEVPDLNKGGIILGNNAVGTLTNINLFNLTNSDPRVPTLTSFYFSDITLQNLQFDNTTSIFNLYDSNITMNTLSISNLRLSSNSQYLINSISSTLTISNLNLTKDLTPQNSLYIVTGLYNKVILSDSHFWDVLYGNNNKLFNLKDGSLFLIVRSTFEYTKSTNLPVIFALESSQNVVIENCVFSNTGQLVQDQYTLDTFYFVGNTILADPSIQKIATTENNITYLLQNQFLASTSSCTSQPSSQIQFSDNSGLVKAQENVFFSLCGSKGIVQITCENYPYSLESYNDIFINNNGSLGGALHLDASVSASSTILPQTAIDASVFLLNNANIIGDKSGKGGAIYQTTSTLIKQNTTITDSTFIKNEAGLVGGALFFDYMPLTVDIKSYFKQNHANQLENHIGSYPVKIKFFETTPPSRTALPSERRLESETLNRWDNVPSGIMTNQTYIIGLVDMFDQIFDSDNTSILGIYPNMSEDDRYLFSNKLTITAQKGLYLLDSLKFTYKTYAALNVTLNSTAIQPDRLISDYTSQSDSALLIEMHFRGCGRGEYIIAEGSTSRCEECQPGFWQTSPFSDVLACRECDTTSTFCLGADKVGPKKDYWRLNATADIVRKCPVSGSCLGSEENLDPQGKCGHGYRGNLCSNCLQGWAKTGNGACTNCSTDIWYYLRVVLVLFMQLILVVLAVQGTMNISKEFDQDQKVKLNGAILVRVLSNYFQLISLVSGLPVTWPGMFDRLSSGVTQVSSVAENVFTLDCMFGSDTVSGIKIVYLKILLTTVGPFALILLGVLGTAAYFAIKKRAILGNKAFVNQIVAIAVVICFMMQPSAIQTAFSLLKCDNLYRGDSPVNFLAKDYDVQCWQGAHLYWALGFGLPILMVWSIGLPYLVFNALRKNKDKLDTAEVGQKYSFLYGGYSPEKYYWELVVMFRKFLLISIIIGASFHSTNLEIYMSILLILFWYMLQLWACPYVDLTLNRLEKYSLISAGLVNFSGLYFKFVPATVSLDIIVMTISLVGNLLFFVYYGMLYLNNLLSKIRGNKKVFEILEKVGKKCKLLQPQKVEKFLTKLSIKLEKITRNDFVRTKSARTIEIARKDDTPISSKRLIAIHPPENHTTPGLLQIEQTPHTLAESPNRKRSLDISEDEDIRETLNQNIGIETMKLESPEEPITKRSKNINEEEEKEESLGENEEAERSEILIKSLD